MIDAILDFLDERVMPVVAVLFIGVIVLVVFVGLPMLGWDIYQDSKKPTFELQKDEWACQQWHQESTTIYVQSGKVMVPVTTTDNVCDDWKRKFK